MRITVEESPTFTIELTEFEALSLLRFLQSANFSFEKNVPDGFDLKTHEALYQALQKEVFG